MKHKLFRINRFYDVADPATPPPANTQGEHSENLKIALQKEREERKAEREELQKYRDAQKNKEEQDAIARGEFDKIKNDLTQKHTQALAEIEAYKSKATQLEEILTAQHTAKLSSFNEDQKKTYEVMKGVTDGSLDKLMKIADHILTLWPSTGFGKNPWQDSSKNETLAKARKSWNLNEIQKAYSSLLNS